MTREPRERKHGRVSARTRRKPKQPQAGMEIHPSLEAKPVKRINESPEWALDED
jgi:hypothetical protein